MLTSIERCGSIMWLGEIECRLFSYFQLKRHRSWKQLFSCIAHYNFSILIHNFHWKQKLKNQS